MKRVLIITAVLLTLFALSAHAKPVQKEFVFQPQDRPGPRVEFLAPMANTSVDTIYLLGGPGNWDGSFETPGGQPDWHGWTHEDVSLNLENHWHVSTYMADRIADKGPGNHAMYCGIDTMPACDPPDTIGGYGNSWYEEIVWRHAVADPGQAVSVRLTGSMNYDTEQGYDYVYLVIQRGEADEVLASWDDQGTDVLDFTTVLSPGEFTGTGLNEVRLAWRFKSDGGWSDADCSYPTRGACQIDDLTVFLDGAPVTFDDFEPGNPVHWTPFQFPGVGDFTNLRSNLPSVHPCQSVNQSYQVNFIDDGVVVPGTGGTPCIDWCYGPGGYIVNNDGGLMNDGPLEAHLYNQAVSPPLGWPAGAEGAELAFDVYFHQPSTIDNPGMAPAWLVRSTSSIDPADLENQNWKYVGNLEFSSGNYRRKTELVSDFMVQDRKWVQIALQVAEFQHRFGWDGPNGSPAPYFDNVSFKVWDPVGPDIQVLKVEAFGDGFPEAGTLDPVNLGANWCRIDNPVLGPSQDRGDSLVVRIEPVRQGATVIDPPFLHWVMQCNPVFDSVRPSAPDPQGILRGVTAGNAAVFPGNISPVEGRWAFDLPDTGFFFPGDRLRYYVISGDNLDGDVRFAVWPPDTSGVLDFTPGSTYPRMAEIHGLPTITQPVAGQFDHPRLLYIDDSRFNSPTQDTWREALDELGLQPGTDVEILTIWASGHLDRILPLDIFSGYQTVIYSGGRYGTTLFEEGALRFNDWLDTGGKNALLAADGLVFEFSHPSNQLGAALADQLGVQEETRNITDNNGGYWDLQVSPVTGGGVLPDDALWQIHAACPATRWITAVSLQGSGQSAATLDPEGNPGGTYSAVVTVDDLGLVNRTALVPFDLDAVSGMTVGSSKSDKAFSPSTQLLYHLLAWLDTGPVSGTEDLPGARRVTVTAHPNPFNPSTTIAFELPRATEVSLDIYDLQGRLVRRLLDESPYISGNHKQVWDGRNAGGQTTASGVYFYRFTAGDQKRVGKLTLLK